MAQVPSGMNLWRSIPSIALSTSSEMPCGNAVVSRCAWTRMVSIIAARSRAHGASSAVASPATTRKATPASHFIVMLASIRRRTSLRLEAGRRDRLGDALLLVLDRAREVFGAAARGLGADLVH